MSLSNTGIDRFLQQNYYSKTQLNAGQLDSRYFAESEFLATSAGAGDAGKPVKLNGSGQVDATMYSSTIVTLTGVQTLTNKTLTSPTMTSPVIDMASNPALSLALSGVARYGIYYNNTGTYFTISETGVADHFVVKNGGNVGIGTTSPSTKLDVAGSVTATGATIGTLAATSATVGGNSVLTSTHAGSNTHAQIDTAVTASTNHIAATIAHGLSGAIVGTTDIQTLVNKTITDPAISRIFGGGTANTDLTLEGTSHATKASSYIIVQPTGGSVVVGGTTTDHQFEIQDQGASNYRMTVNLDVSGVNYFNSYSAGVGTLTPAPLTIVSSALGTTGDTFRIETTKTPASAADSGSAGQIAWDTSFLYIATGTNQWRRISHASW